MLRMMDRMFFLVVLKDPNGSLRFQGFTSKVSDLVLGKSNPLDLAVTTGYLGLQSPKI